MKSFLPENSLIEMLPTIATIQFTRNYADYVAQLPIPCLYTAGIDNVELKGEINMLQKVINFEYPKVQSLAQQWFGITENDIIQTFTDLQHFANVEFHSYYDYIYYHNNKNDKTQLKNSLSKLKNAIFTKQVDTKKALSALVVYEGDLTNYSVVLKNTYNQACITLQSVTKYTEELNSVRSQLREQLKANNKKVAKIGMETTQNIIKEGTVIAQNVATEDYEGAVKTGSILAINSLEAGVNVVSLDVQSIKLINQIKDLTLKLSDLERDLQVLNDAVAQMDSIMDSHIFSKEIITFLEKYWMDMESYVDGLIDEVNQGKTLDLPKAKELDSAWVDSIATPLKHILSFKSLSSLSQWNANKVSFNNLK